MTTLLIRYKLIVAYDGTRFIGFQRQNSGNNNDESDSDDCDNNINENSSTTTTATSSTAAQHKKQGQKQKLQKENSMHFKRRRIDQSNGQIKKTNLTVQEFLEDAIEQYSGLTRQQQKLRFAGRTDGGVHARGQVCAIYLPEQEQDQELWQIRKSINSRLPVDISVENVSIISSDNPDFDPRKDVKLKRYSYTIKYRRKVFDSDDGKPIQISRNGGPHLVRHGLDPATIWVCPWSLDDSKIDDLCLTLQGQHDFSVFVHKSSRRDKDNTLTLEKLECIRNEATAVVANDDGDDYAQPPVVLATFIFESKGFRRSMVRNLVGFMVDVMRGSISIIEEDEEEELNHNTIMTEIWTGHDEVAKKIHSAPACGLCLEHVMY